MHDALVWARRALNHPKRRFPAPPGRVSGVQVAELGKGGSFGEAAVMAATEAERTRTATVEAAEDEGLLSFITPRSRLYGESL